MAGSAEEHELKSLAMGASHAGPERPREGCLIFTIRSPWRVLNGGAT